MPEACQRPTAATAVSKSDQVEASVLDAILPVLGFTGSFVVRPSRDWVRQHTQRGSALSSAGTLLRSISASRARGTRA